MDKTYSAAAMRRKDFVTYDFMFKGFQMTELLCRELQSFLPRAKNISLANKTCDYLMNKTIPFIKSGATADHFKNAYSKHWETKNKDVWDSKASWKMLLLGCLAG